MLDHLIVNQKHSFNIVSKIWKVYNKTLPSLTLKINNTIYNINIFLIHMKSTKEKDR